MSPKKKGRPPASHIVVNEDPAVFLKEVNEFFGKGYRPIQDMTSFAELDPKTNKWRTLYIMPLVHYEEFKEFQTVPTSDEDQPERMFG